MKVFLQFIKIKILTMQKSEEAISEDYIFFHMYF